MIHCPHRCVRENHFQTMALGHKNILHIETEEKTIKVDDVRKIHPFLANKSFDGDMNIAVIHDAHTMTVQAQNALLKVLEEPPDNSSILLLSENLSLLATVLSRCRIVKLKPDPDCLQRVLGAGVDEQRSELLCRLSGGYALFALTLNEDEDFFEIRQNVFAIVEKICNTNTYAFSAHSTYFEGIKDKTQTALEIMKSAFLDMLLTFETAEFVKNIDFLPMLQRTAKKYAPKELIALWDIIDYTANAIKQNANVRITVDAMFINILEVVHDKSNRNTL